MIQFTINYPLLVLLLYKNPETLVVNFFLNESHKAAHKQQRQFRSRSPFDPKYNSSSQLNSPDRNDESAQTELVPFELNTLVVATSNFSSNNKLGRGGFGPVYKVISFHFTVRIHILRNWKIVNVSTISGSIA